MWGRYPAMRGKPSLTDEPRTISKRCIRQIRAVNGSVRVRIMRMTRWLCHAGYTGHIAASPTGGAVAVITPDRDVAHVYTQVEGAWLRAGTFDPKAASGTGRPRNGADVAETRQTATNIQRSSPPVGPLLLTAWAPDALTLAVAAGNGQVFLIKRHVTEYAVSHIGACLLWLNAERFVAWPSRWRGP